MVDKKGRRRFGNLRQLPSGRWQVRYRGPDGQLRSLPRTFEKKRDAERTLSMIETQLVQDDWADPKMGAEFGSAHSSSISLGGGWSPRHPSRGRVHGR
jgi:hypothetical protein